MARAFCAVVLTARKNRRIMHATLAAVKWGKRIRFECNRNTPHFTASEIHEIYEAASEKSTQALRTTAKSLFPDRDPVMYENLTLEKGHGRAFMHQGEYRLPEWTTLAWPEMYGVMEDGTIYLFSSSPREQNEMQKALKPGRFNAFCIGAVSGLFFLC